MVRKITFNHVRYEQGIQQIYTILVLRNVIRTRPSALTAQSNIDGYGKSDNRRTCEEGSDVRS